MRAIAITDHDTIDGLNEATEASATTGLEVVPGIELSSNSGHAEIHLLGYFIDARSSRLLDHLEWCRVMRIERIEKMCERLTQAGLPLTFDEVASQSAGGSMGRPHVAKAMIARGYVASIGEAFQRYLASGKPGYVRRENVDPATAIGIIRSAGGVAVMAHPLATSSALSLLPELIAAGLAGLEAWYGEYEPSARERLAAIARDHGLIATGGSDYHGENFKEGRGLGTVDVPSEVITSLRAAAGFAAS